MTDLPFFGLGHEGGKFSVVIALLAIVLTIVSLMYVRPKDCSRLCEPSEPLLCGKCRIGEQKAGWPLPVFVDMTGGGSPTSGWRKLGPEDPPNPVTFTLDVLFHAVLLWLLFCCIQVVREKELPAPFIRVLPLAALLAAFVWLIYLIFGPFRNS